MSMDVLAIEYEQMDHIAQQFGAQSELIGQICQKIAQDYQLLQTDWAGEAATHFFTEMQTSIFPAFERLKVALATSQQVALKVKSQLYDGENEASRLFQGAFSATVQHSNGPGVHRGISLKNEYITDPEYRKVEQPAFVQGAGDGDSIAMNDVDQGSLGDCYLMAGTAAIANTRPDVIRNAIKDNGDGTYTVTLYPEDGFKGFFGVRSKVEVTVNNEFVHSKSTGALGYAQLSNDSEIWPMLIEKAYAQYKGGYSNIESGSAGEFMAILTGNDSSYIENDDIDFANLKQKLDRGDAITAGTYDALENAPTYVHEDHAYAIQSIDLENQTVSLYNPWGHEHPTVSFDEFRANYEGVNVNEKE